MFLAFRNVLTAIEVASGLKEDSGRHWYMWKHRYNSIEASLRIGDCIWVAAAIHSRVYKLRTHEPRAATEMTKSNISRIHNDVVCVYAERSGGWASKGREHETVTSSWVGLISPREWVRNFWWRGVIMKENLHVWEGGAIVVAPKWRIDFWILTTSTTARL